MGQYSLKQWLWLLKKSLFTDGGWGYRASQCQRGSHEIGQSALCKARWPWGWVCLRWQVTVSMCASHTHPPPCVFETAITSQHTEGLGVGIQFHFFFWQMTPWQLEKMLGSLNRFLSYKNKTCWIRQRQTFYILLLNPNESTDKCHPTPTPSVPWLFFLSRNVI